MLVACAKTETPPADTTTAVPPPPPAAAAPAINDAQIAHIAVTANAIDSAAGQLAKQKGAAKTVKDFAQTMITDHSGVNKQAVALATKLNVTPEDNDVSRQLKSGADASAANLNGLSGAAFDKAYIDNEVAYHQAVLDALDKTLIPSAQNAELKALAREGAPRLRRAPRSREDAAGFTQQVAAVMIPLRVAIASATLAGAIAGCAGAPRTHTVVMRNFGFDPATRDGRGRRYGRVVERRPGSTHGDRPGCRVGLAVHRRERRVACWSRPRPARTSTTACSTPA